MSEEETVTLYRRVGQAERDLIRASGNRAFPPRLSQQPLFYLVLDEEYAIQIARDRNTRAVAPRYIAYVTRFRLPAAYLRRYPVRTIGGRQQREYWIPAEELDEFNRQIAGEIEVIAEFRP